jgi:hypothetical protein
VNTKAFGKKEMEINYEYIFLFSIKKIKEYYHCFWFFSNKKKKKKKVAMNIYIVKKEEG